GPEAVAVVYEGEEISYRELNQRANQLAHYLRKKGVGPEVLVGLCVERSVEMVVGLLGILKAGGAYVPLDPSYPAERLEFMLRDSQVQVLITQRNLRTVRIGDEQSLVFLDDCTQVPMLPDVNVPAPVAPANLAYVMYTSGSTGN